jgi:DNA-binding GntR family transcriptional regulator
MLRSDKPKSLSEVVIARLRREIVEGEFEFGQALSESKIAARYDVSRTPVREAFAILGLEGLVRTEPQYGTFVFTMDRDQFTELSETRSILETAALRLAMERNQQALVRKWKRLVSDMAAAFQESDGRRYSRQDDDFHQALFDLASNSYLDAAGQSFFAKMSAVRHRLGARPEHMQRSYAEHVQLLELVEQDQVHEAVNLLEHHIRYKGESFWDTPAMPKTRWEKISDLAG